MIAAEIQAKISSGPGRQQHLFPENFSVETLAETLVAMANGSGGEIWIGVAPRSGVIIGLQNPEQALDRAVQAALQLDPPLALPMPELVESPATLIRVTVPSGMPQVYNLSGRYLIRNEQHNVTLSGTELRALLLTRSSIQFESQPVPEASLADLDADQVDEYLGLIPTPSGATEQRLIQRGCLIEHQNSFVPTYAGLLLFGRTPQRWLPNAGILAARFTGSTLGDEYVKQEIGGTLPYQIRLAEQFCRDQLRSTARLDGLVRTDRREYPLEAIRELLVNAVAHRDYDVRGDGIHVHIFSDRLELHSPGELPGPVTLDNLLQARFSRNPIIVQVLADMGFIERLGYGIDRVVRVVREQGLPAPGFIETGGTFRVTLTAAPGLTVSPDSSVLTGLDLSDLDLHPRQKAALEHLAVHQRITNRDYQALCPEVHTETLRRDLADLVQRGLLLKIGNRKSTYYIFK
jgi:ATP-dependent DNA helicase RecG